MKLYLSYLIFVIFRSFQLESKLSQLEADLHPAQKISKDQQQATIEDIRFETYATTKALSYLCKFPPENIDTEFKKIKDLFFDESNKLLDHKLQDFIKISIKPNYFGKTSKFLTEENQHQVLELLVLIVVGKSQKFPLTTKVVFDFVTLIEHKKQFLEECFQSDDGVTDLVNCILLQVQGLRLRDNDIKNEVCNCSDKRHQLLVEWVSNLFEVKEEEKYQQAFKSLAIAYLQVHGYKENVIADCIQRQNEFRKDDRRYRAPILESIITLLPVTTRFGTLSSWLSFAVILTLLSSLFYLGDFGSDVFLGLEYRPSFNITTCLRNGTDT